MNKDQEKMLEELGWTIECESPLEIRHSDGSFISGLKAKEYISFLEKENKTSKQELEEGIINKIISYEENTGKIIGCIYFEADSEEKFSFNGEKFVKVINNKIITLPKDSEIVDGTIDALIRDLLELKESYSGETAIGFTKYNGGDDIVVSLSKDNHYEEASGLIVLGSKHIF